MEEPNIGTALDGLPGWRPEAEGGKLRFRNEAQNLVLTVKKLPWSTTALSGEVRLDAPDCVSTLRLAMAEGVSDEALLLSLRRRFDGWPVMALLTRLLPVIRDFLLLQMPGSN